MKKNVFLMAGILLLSLLLLPGLSGCGAISSLVATPTPTATSTPTMTPTPIPTSTPTPPEGVTYLQAPESLLRLWSQWNGRYVIYAHKSAGIDTLDDLNGMVLLIAFIEVGPNDILRDAQQLAEAGGISMSFAIQNNPNVYSGNLLEDSSRVGFMVSEVADHYEFDENQDLIRIEFQE